MAHIKLLFTAFSYSITSFSYIAVIWIIYLHVKKNAQLEESWLGFLRSPVRTQLFDVLLYSMLAGLLGSSLMVFLGIVIDYYAAMLIWPAVLLMAAFEKRYFSFVYAGTVVSIATLLFGWPSMNVSSMIAAVGIVYLMESLLVWVDGHRDNIPVLLEYSPSRPVGAYVARKWWPVPFVMLTSTESMLNGASTGLNMPAWWPLFPAQPALEPLVLLPFVIVLGYRDIAVTRSPRGRAKESSFWLGLFSIVVLWMALVSYRVSWFKYPAVICTPLLYEVLFFINKRGSFNKKPIYGAPWRGLRILEVFPGDVAENMGLRSGDIILDINSKSVNSLEMLNKILEDAPPIIWISVQRGKEILTFEYRDYRQGIQNLGVMIVPRRSSKFFMMGRNKKGFLECFMKWSKREGI